MAVLNCYHHLADKQCFSATNLYFSRFVALFLVSYKYVPKVVTGDSGNIIKLLGSGEIDLSQVGKKQPISAGC